MNSPMEIIPQSVLALMLLLGVVSGPADASESTSVETATNRFGLDLLHQVRAQASDEPNIIISPLSAALALDMVYLGAEGQTKEAMNKTLHLPDVSRGELTDLLAGTMNKLDQSDSTVVFNLANSAWLNEVWEFNQEYLSTVRSCLEAELSRVNYSDPSTRDRINNWVSEATEGKIDEIIETVEPDMAMILINALYFKADWEKQFNKSNTQIKPFTLLDGSTIDHHLMSLTDWLRYAETPEMEIVELAYKGQQQSMFVLLPSDSLTVDELLDRMTYEWWKENFDRLEYKHGHLELPRFALTSDFMLNNALTDLGMGVAFSPNEADLSSMLAGGELPTGERLYISEVRQKTFIEVMETGTEAAAATSVGIRVTAALGDPESVTFEMKVDRPFVFVLADEATGIMHFVGKVGDPRQ